MRKQLIGLLSVTWTAAAMAQQPIVPPMIQPGGPGSLDLLPGLQPGPGNLPPGADPGPLLQGAPTYPSPGPYGQQRYQSQDIARFSGGSPAPVLWFDGQFLLLFPKNGPSPAPLVTTSDNITALGVLRPGNSTRILHGGEEFRFGGQAGFRLIAGFWRPEDQRLGFEIVGMYMGPRSDAFSGASGTGGSPLFARPFFNTNPLTPTTGGGFGPGPDSVIISIPITQRGSIVSRASTRGFGMEATGLLNIYRGTGERAFTFNLLAGYRMFELDEVVSVDSSTTVINGGLVTVGGVNVAAPGVYSINDTFRTSNRFHGGEVGFQSKLERGRWMLSSHGKFGAGVIAERIEIYGLTTSSVLGVTNQSMGGLLANNSNIGLQRQTKFGFLTDVNMTLGFLFTPRLIGQVGYNFIHMSQVARPGNVYGGNVDPVLAPADPNFGTVVPVGSPGKFIKNDDFYLHGLNFGLLMRF